MPALPNTAPDRQRCRDIARRHARTFALASLFLPEEKRRAAYAVYAFCRTADDLVDADGDVSLVERGARLAELAAALDDAVAGRPEGPILRELAWAVARFDIPSHALRGLLAGVGRDLQPVRYGTWQELGAYCEGVASTVGEMCAHVFGLPRERDARLRALRYARTLGVAMQLTNILRDVGEDAARGRCYLPDDDLARVGLGRDEVLRGAVRPDDPRWRTMMALLVGRARALYEASVPGIALLAPDARRCALACAAGYASILGAIERAGYDTLTRRARVGTAERARLLLQVWRTPVERGAAPEHALPAHLTVDGLRDSSLVRLA